MSRKYALTGRLNCVSDRHHVRALAHMADHDLGIVGKVKFEARIQELVETFPDSSYTAVCWPSCETTRCAGTWRVSARKAFYVWPAVAATECPWRLLPRCRNGTSTNAKAVKAADERMSRVRLS